MDNTQAALSHIIKMNRDVKHNNDKKHLNTTIMFCIAGHIEALCEKQKQNLV